jgi:hypothetical protein
LLNAGIAGCIGRVDAGEEEEDKQKWWRETGKEQMWLDQSETVERQAKGKSGEGT